MEKKRQKIWAGQVQRNSLVCARNSHCHENPKIHFLFICHAHMSLLTTQCTLKTLP